MGCWGRIGLVRPFSLYFRAVLTLNCLVDKELEKKETSFSSFRELTVLITSWNCDSARPDSLTGINQNFFDEVLHSVDQAPNVIVFGFQEVIDLESRKMVAKDVLLGEKRRARIVAFQKRSPGRTEGGMIDWYLL